MGEAKGDRWDLGWHHPDPQRQGRVYTQAGGFLDRIDGFDAEFFGMSPREVRQVDPQQRLLLELAWEAHEDAGIAPRSRAGSETGVFVGISSNDYASLVGAGWPDAYSNTGEFLQHCGKSHLLHFRFSRAERGHGHGLLFESGLRPSCLQEPAEGECSTALAGGVSILMAYPTVAGLCHAPLCFRPPDAARALTPAAMAMCAQKAADLCC